MSLIYNPSPAFREAAAYLSSAPALGSVSNATKLELYAIFKYLTVAPTPNTPKPSIFDFAGKAKWDAWRSAGETYKNRPADAESRYLEIARSLGWSEGKQAEPRPQKAETPAAGEGNEDEDDIWDSDSETAQSRDASSGVGRVLSTMVALEGGGESASVVSNFAIAGDARGLEEYLQEHPEVDVNARDENGYTALHLGADRGHVDVVKVLLKRGADPGLQDQDEFTAKELAEIAGHEEIVHLLSGTHNPPP